MTLQKTMDELANKLKDKAAQKDTPLQESIDAFKALTAYYAARQKSAKKSGEDDEPETGGFTFAGSDEVVNGERQHPQVRTRRNS